MNPIISAIRSILVTIINRIDNGDCDIATDEADELISVLRKYTDKDKRMSKYQACEYLKISRATFDNYVTNGWIPRGIHQQGFKELFWLQKDLDKFKQSYKK
jgi:predicted DNA-binding transcriptional regulator AlpA